MLGMGRLCGIVNAIARGTYFICSTFGRAAIDWGVCRRGPVVGGLQKVEGVVSPVPNARRLDQPHGA